MWATSCEILVASAKIFSRIGDQESATSDPKKEIIITGYSVLRGAPPSFSLLNTNLADTTSSTAMPDKKTNDNVKINSLQHASLTILSQYVIRLISLFKNSKAI